MKCLNQEGLKYLWKRIKALVEPLATRSQLEAVLSGLQTQLNTKADTESGICTLKLCSSSGVEVGTASGTYEKIGDLVYIQANFFHTGDLSDAITRIKGFPFTVSNAGGASNASALHYVTSGDESPKTFSVPSYGYVACTAMKPSSLFIYGTYTL